MIHGVNDQGLNGPPSNKFIGLVMDTRGAAACIAMFSDLAAPCEYCKRRQFDCAKAVCDCGPERIPQHIALCVLLRKRLRLAYACLERLNCVRIY